MTYDEYLDTEDDKLSSMNGWRQFDDVPKLKSGTVLFHTGLGYVWFSRIASNGIIVRDRRHASHCLETDDLAFMFSEETESLPEATPQTEHECTLCGTTGAYQGFTQDECLNEECGFYSEAWQKSCSPCATQEEEPVAMTKTDMSECFDSLKYSVHTGIDFAQTSDHTVVAQELFPETQAPTTVQWQDALDSHVRCISAGNLSPQEYLLPPKETSDDSSPSRTTLDLENEFYGSMIPDSYSVNFGWTPMVFSTGPRHGKTEYQRQLVRYCESLGLNVVVRQADPCTPSQGQSSTHRDCIRPPAPEVPAETSPPVPPPESPTTIQLCLFCARHGCKDMQCVR